MVGPFIILSLPRSRTFWLSKFLSHNGWFCGHDEARHMRSIDDVRSWFNQPYTGSVETAIAPFWRLLPHLVPNIKIVTLRRNPVDVINSMHNIGFNISEQLIKTIYSYDRKLDQLEYRLSNVRSIKFDDLDDKDICGDLFEYLTATDRDDDRYRLLSQLNLQIDMPALMRYYGAYRNQLNKLAKTAKSQTISLMQPHEIINDGIIIKEESIDILVRDAKSLFAEHLIDVGESPDSYMNKNIPLMQKLEEVGALQTMIARCNGRVFGYLMSIISPSLERRDTKTGVHTLFHTSKEVKNLGMRLQRASVDALKDKGCDEIIFRAGVRGSTAERIAVLYKRLGAEPFGELYRLEVEK